MKATQTLKFYWLRYEVSAIQNLINDNPGIDEFVFCYYFPHTENTGKPIQLIAYAHMESEDPAGGSYSDYYDILDVHNNSALELAGPIIMSNNIVSAAAIQSLIGTPDQHNDLPEYLLFVPAINTLGHLYYDIKSFSRHSSGPDTELIVGSDPNTPINTNPSPPATLY